MYLWAQVPTASPEQFYAVVIGLLAIIVALNYASGLWVNIKKVREGLPSSEQYVTKGQLSALEAAIDLKFAELEKCFTQCASKGDLQKLTADLEKLTNYTRQSVHDIRDDLAPINTNMAVIVSTEQMMQKQMDSIVANMASDREKQIELMILVKSMVPKEKQHG